MSDSSATNLPPSTPESTEDLSGASVEITPAFLPTVKPPTKPDEPTKDYCVTQMDFLREAKLNATKRKSIGCKLALPENKPDRMYFLEMALQNALHRLIREEDSLMTAMSTSHDWWLPFMQAVWRAQERLDTEVYGADATRLTRGLRHLEGDPWWDAALDSLQQDKFDRG